MIAEELDCRLLWTRPLLLPCGRNLSVHVRNATKPSTEADGLRCSPRCYPIYSVSDQRIIFCINSTSFCCVVIKLYSFNIVYSLHVSRHNNENMWHATATRGSYCKSPNVPDSMRDALTVFVYNGLLRKIRTCTVELEGDHPVCPAWNHVLAVWTYLAKYL